MLTLPARVRKLEDDVAAAREEEDRMGARLRTAEEEAAQLHLEREESLRSLQQRAGADSELLVRGLSWLKSCPRYGGCRALPVLQGKDTRSTWSRDSSRPELPVKQRLDRSY